jgi:hypothetical protein
MYHSGLVLAFGNKPMRMAIALSTSALSPASSRTSCQLPPRQVLLSSLVSHAIVKMRLKSRVL